METTAPRLVLPTDPRIRSLFGEGNPSRKALNKRLKRAERAGVLPKRRYLSSQRFVYDADELEAALADLPTEHLATLRRNGDDGEA